MHFGEYELSPGLIGLSPLPSPHPEAFQRQLVRSSIRCYPDFNLDKGRSPGFASAASDFYALFGLAFATAPRLRRLAWPDTATRRFIMQKARRHGLTTAPTACRRTVSGSLSSPCAGYFSPFPHGTGSLSVSCEYLALADGPAGFSLDSSCPGLLRYRTGNAPDSRMGLSPATARLSSRVTLSFACPSSPALQPRRRLHAGGLGSSLFARRYWGNHSYFLFLRVLRCFSSPR